MTIKIGFTYNREIIFFEIENKKIKYFDRKWNQGVQFMPKDPELIKKLIMSRNKIPMSQQILDWVQQSNSGKNLEEYSRCTTDEEVAAIVRRDAASKGLVEVKVDD